MNQDSPGWLDSLSSAEATAMPEAIVTALRARRRQRHRIVAAGSAGVATMVAVAGLAWYSARPVPSVPHVPLAERPVAPTPGGPPSDVDRAVTVATAYRADQEPVDDQLAIASTGADERLLRIGDHWDPDRVEAWVLD